MGEIIVTGESREELLVMLEGVPKERAIDLTPLPRRDQCFSFEEIESLLKSLVPRSSGNPNDRYFGWTNVKSQVDSGYLMALSDVRQTLQEMLDEL